MFHPGTKIGVVCDQYGRPSRDAHQTLTGEVLCVIPRDCGYSYSIRIDFHNGEWLVTTTEDETLLFQTFH